MYESVSLLRLLDARAHWVAALLGCLAAAGAGCAASVPKDSYGVRRLELRGNQHFDAEAIKACLATSARERFGFALGDQATRECGVPPFDASRVPIALWAWPWTERPIFNETAFERDLDRIERWYRARGYYDTAVTNVRLDRDEADREIQIEIQVSEGEPVLVLRIDVLGLEGLPAPLQRAVREAIALRVGDPFDEALYERSKRDMLQTLQEASYARAQVQGSAEVDPGKRLAKAVFTAKPGPACHFGEVVVEGNRELPAAPVRAAAAIQEGTPYSLTALKDARFAIYALGAFAGVEVQQLPRSDSPVVDVVLRVVPARAFRLGVGVGISSGGLFAQEAESTSSFAQWDIHLLGRVEHSNFLGGMRRLRVEERPRFIFDNPFPSTVPNSVGNLLTVELRQPAFIEARTSLVARVRWDLGPDPYGGRFLRHDVVAGVGPERYFLGGKLFWASSINADLFIPESEDLYPNTELGYFYHVVRLDLRDDPRNTTRGSYFSLGFQHAGYVLPSDWNYYRITQDSRGYIPLVGGIVLAMRGQIGFMNVTSNRIDVPPNPDTNGSAALLSPEDLELQRERYTFRQNLAQFGPLRHRLRGGGYNNVRGYAPNMLGDVEIIQGRLLSGGLRQWAASVELRIPLTESFGTVLFADVGDVTRQTHYRFNYPQTSLGIGLRYRTIVGPLRLDAALAPPNLQVIGTDNRIRTGVPQSTILGADGAISFTIGEAF